MRIAFTHNLQLTDSEEEAEFDTPRTVAALTESLGRLGHDVEPVEVSGPASRTVARLEALGPDLIFNTAEGRLGRYREAFYPGLFEQLGIPYTGSDAYVCALTLDKQLTKLVLAAHGVRTPRWSFVDDLRDFVAPELTYPVIVKPNFEGSSKGITMDSIVERPEDLGPKLATTLAKYPSGMLVEEFIVGHDVVVPFLEKASPQTGGVLAAAEYQFDPRLVAGRRYQIYDYELKHAASDGVEVRCPALLAPELETEIARMARVVYRVLGIRDLGRIDFRVTPEGQAYFLEINALPSLEPGAGIYLAASLAGLPTMDDVLRTVVKSAAERQHVPVRAGRRGRKATSLRVGLTFNLKRVSPKDGGDDREAEYDPPETIGAIKDAIASFGHEVIELEATPELPSILPVAGVDVVFNLAEGIRGRNRESQIPAMLELLDIPYTGSDPATLALALDKALAKRIVQQAGLPTPGFALFASGKERLPKDFAFPVIVKPNAEGSSKGVIRNSVAEDEAQMREIVRECIARYRQPALVEQFLPGREFTVALLGERRPRVLPPMEIVFTSVDAKHPVYSFDHKLDWSKEIRYDAPAKVDAALGKDLERVARGCFGALGCRDVARIDLRLDARGRACFIECNPLPGLTPGWSDLCMIATSAGMDYRTLIGDILAPAIKRFRERRRERRAVQEIPRIHE